MKDLVFEKFKQQVEHKGMKIDSVDKTGLLYISLGDGTLKVSLDNLRKDYNRDSDETYISDFVKSLDAYSVQPPSKWRDAKDSVFLSLFPSDFNFEDIVHRKITDKVCNVYVYTGHDILTWITQEDLKRWNISEKELDEQAMKNADKLLEKTSITFDTIENHKLGQIDVEHSTLTAALLFAPSMKEKVKADFGYPFYAVIPVRDFCYLFSEKDYPFISNRIGEIVVDEYKNSGYPITTEILKISDKGVESVGEYPVK